MWEGYQGSFMATEELLKLIQEDPMGYEGYLAYAKYLETINLKQAYLTYENALYFCDDETMKKTIQSKLDEIAYRNGKVEPASIVILCYNNRPLTQQCIESIRETTPEFAREIVIVDNNSQDDSVNYLRQQKDIVLIENDYNAGFPGGCNIGIEAAKPENDIFLLNNDTIMCFNTLYTLRMGLYEKDNYGSAGCVTNNCANNQSVFKSESLDDLKEFGRNNNIPNKRSEIKLMLIGFALIVKRKVLEKVGYLDERFNPGNFEDDDLSLRILMNNYQNVLVYNSFLIHLGSVSFNNADYFNLLHKNFDKLIDKYNFINEKHFFCFTHSECNLPFYKDKIDNLYNNANVLVSQCDLYLTFYFHRFCDCSIWLDGRSCERVCIPRLCRFNYLVHSNAGTFDSLSLQGYLIEAVYSAFFLLCSFVSGCYFVYNYFWLRLGGIVWNHTYTSLYLGLQDLSLEWAE